MMSALLVLEDGTFFTGRAFGTQGEAVGEVSFNTSMSGYQELLTDPASRGRLLAMTSNHIGNYGVNAHDGESDGAHAAGLIVRNVSRIASNHRSTGTLDAYMVDNGVVGITEVDTRALTLHVREHGAQMAMIVHGATDADRDGIVERLRAMPRHEEIDYAASVSVDAPTRALIVETGDRYHAFVVERADETAAWSPSQQGLKDIVVIDLGGRNSVLEMLHSSGFRATLVPYNTNAAAILARGADAVLISSGPGNPEMRGDVAETIRGLLGQTPIFGVGLGFQLLSIALGGETFKLRVGHNGQNIPVRSDITQRVEITKQSHGFGVRFPAPIEGLELTHKNLNDQSIEGIRMASKRAMGVQHQPEAGAGLFGTSPLFDVFAAWTSVG